MRKGVRGQGSGVRGSLAARARKIRLLILDVDGVMTDGRIILDNLWKAFHVRDGHAIKMAQQAGLQVAIVTGRQSEVVNRRAAELGVQRVYQKIWDKVAVLETILREEGMTAEEAAFIGDDSVDLPLLGRVGLSMAVADADAEVRRRVHWVARERGGRGAVREAIAWILKAQGKWPL